MVIPSVSSTLAFVFVIAWVVLGVVVGMHFAGRGRGDSAARSRRWTLGTAAAAVVWMAVTGAISGSGLLEAPGFPPRVMIFLVGCNVAALVFACSRAGTRLVEGLPVAALVGFHAFRLPLEFILHRWYAQGVLPVQMTYSGRNFDIVTGALALLVGLWLWRRGTSRPLVWGFNLVGTALLFNVGALAVLSSPVPFRVFMNEPAVLLAFYFPYGWIVPLCVAPALAGHVLIFRWLWRNGAAR